MMRLMILVCLLLMMSVAMGQTDDGENVVNAPFLPPDGQRLLILGQDLGAVGGLDDYSEGYTDTVGIIPAGITTYTGISDLGGLESQANWGSGDVNAQAIVGASIYDNSVISIGLFLGSANLTGVINGSFDGNIATLGDWISAADRPVFVRIGYEFDGEWNAYDPGRYIAAYQYIVDAWRGQDVTNFASVWQSATWHLGTYRGLHWMAWYPGDDYVDWFGMSYFVRDIDLFDDFLDLAREHQKPVMISEATPQGHFIERDEGDEIWDAWFDGFFDFIDDNADVIRAVAYINVDWYTQPMWEGNIWGDSRVQSDDVILERWLAEIERDVWLHSSDDLFSRLGFGEVD